MRIFATSIAFGCAAIAITVVMWALEAAGQQLIPGQQVENWLQQGTYIVIYALLAGFLVDSIRWLIAVARVPAPHRNRNRHRTEACLSD